MNEEHSEQKNDQQTDAQQAQHPEGHHGKNAVVPAVLAIIVVVLALMYVWGSHLQAPSTAAPVADMPAAPSAPPAGSAVAPDDLAAIQTDLNMPELTTLDSEVSTMGQELDASTTVQ